MHVQRQFVVEPNKKMLTVRKRLGNTCPINQRSPFSVAALRASNTHPLPGKHIVELAGYTVNRVAFRHALLLSGRGKKWGGTYLFVNMFARDLPGLLIFAKLPNTTGVAFLSAPGGAEENFNDFQRLIR